MKTVNWALKFLADGTTGMGDRRLEAVNLESTIPTIELFIESRSIGTVVNFGSRWEAYKRIGPGVGFIARYPSLRKAVLSVVNNRSIF